MVNQLQHPGLHIPVLDDDPSVDEVNAASKHMGTGTSLDGLSPDILKILPPSMINLILCFMKSCFRTKYPDIWKSQLLFPHPKKGHTSTEPKLRGIPIAPLISRIYDIILNSRFCKWFIPNKEQAGFRKGQGCLLQIFTLYLLMELAKSLKKELFVAFLYYEKAFDFLNPPKLAEKMIQKGIGMTYIHALYDMYSHMTYTPKISATKLGGAIVTKHGVTQGRSSSENYYSFNVSDMADSLHHLTKNEYLDPCCLTQLIDDTLPSDKHR